MPNHWEIPHLITATRRAMTDHVLTRAKAYAALVGSVLTVLASTLPPDPETQKWLGLATAVCTAVATFVIPNQPVDD